MGNVCRFVLVRDKGIFHVSLFQKCTGLGRCHCARQFTGVDCSVVRIPTTSSAPPSTSEVDEAGWADRNDSGLGGLELGGLGELGEERQRYSVVHLSTTPTPAIAVAPGQDNTLLSLNIRSRKGLAFCSGGSAVISATQSLPDDCRVHT